MRRIMLTAVTALLLSIGLSRAATTIAWWHFDSTADPQADSASAYGPWPLYNTGGWHSGPTTY